MGNELNPIYGTYRYKYYDDNNFVCGSIANEEEYEALKIYIPTLSNIEYFAISRIVNNKIEVEVVIDNGL